MKRCNVIRYRDIKFDINDQRFKTIEIGLEKDHRDQRYNKFKRVLRNENGVMSIIWLYTIGDAKRLTVLA